MTTPDHTPTRYRLEVHTLTGDQHIGAWVNTTPEAAEAIAEKFLPCSKESVRIMTTDGTHVIVPPSQVATVRIVADQHSRKKATR
ncbi:hypothetical protein [Nocardiopsis tropica]|uniref:Uncharacterized protein n=1 Tax=Nocardiopsis tropica TaxID=109330 RepID=A0ABU7KM12_9ACTN|nr:hypothetical protein [Nocardiopsis umidischolae]MEE2050325.1 hypothetical protein [Nocardiopsis umidischolae]